MHPGQHSYTFLPWRLHVANILPIYWWYLMIMLVSVTTLKRTSGIPKLQRQNVKRTSLLGQIWTTNFSHPALFRTQRARNMSGQPQELFGPKALFICRSALFLVLEPHHQLELNRCEASWGPVLRAREQCSESGRNRWNRWIEIATTYCNHNRRSRTRWTMMDSGDPLMLASYHGVFLTKKQAVPYGANSVITQWDQDGSGAMDPSTQRVELLKYHCTTVAATLWWPNIAMENHHF